MSETKLGRGDYGDFLRRWWALAGGELVGQHISPDIVAVQLLEGPRPAWHFLLREKLLGGYVTAPAPTAGQIMHVVMNNPAASRTMFELEKLSIHNPEGTTQRFLVAGGVGEVAGITAVGTSGSARDSRWQQAPTTGSLFTTAMSWGYLSAAVGMGAVWYQVSVPTLETREVEFPVIITPGNSMIVHPVAADVDFTAAFLWQERPRRPAE